MDSSTEPNQHQVLPPNLKSFERSDLRRSLTQLFVTMGLFVALWFLMVASLSYGYWATLILALPAAGFLVRLFIIQHDCGHGSFFSSQRTNDLVGGILGVITLTPYRYWRKSHAIHHATNGDLDGRGSGDITTLTVKEYLALSKAKRFGYRLYRSPWLLLGFGPLYLLLVKYRIPFDLPLSRKREWLSVMATNAAVFALIVGMGMIMGWDRFLLISIPIVMFAYAAGIWLFYVNHQFEETYWEKSGSWNFHEAAIQGSSYLDLPPIVNWFTGSIGVHHVHHYSSRIPNYFLAACHETLPQNLKGTRLSFLNGLRSFRLKLWDEEQRRLVGFPK